MSRNLDNLRGADRQTKSNVFAHLQQTACCRGPDGGRATAWLLCYLHTHACMLSAHIARAPPSPLSRVDSLTAKNITRRLPPHWGCTSRRGISVQYSHRRQRHRGRRGHVPADSWSTGDELHYITGNVSRLSSFCCRMLNGMAVNL